MTDAVSFADKLGLLVDQFDKRFPDIYRTHIQDGAAKLGIDPEDRLLRQDIDNITFEFALKIALRALGHDPEPSLKTVRDVLEAFSKGDTEAINRDDSAQVQAKAMLLVGPLDAADRFIEQQPTNDLVETTRRAQAYQREAARIVGSFAKQGRAADQIFDDFLGKVDAISDHAGFPRSLGSKSDNAKTPATRVALARLMIGAACAYATSMIERAGPGDRRAVEAAFNKFRSKKISDLIYSFDAARDRRAAMGENTAD